MNHQQYSNGQVISLVTLRILTGWHLLYEGLIKIFDPNWSAASFLNNASGPFTSLFKAMASNPGVLGIVNTLNKWGLVLVGMSLILGLLSRWASIGGAVLLFLYYIVAPPFIGIDQGLVEGNYLVVNKNLIEIFVFLALFFFPTDRIVGVGRLICRR